jgi:hypothetical protein
LPELLTQIPAQLTIQLNGKLFNFSLETTGVLLDEISVIAKGKRISLNDTREQPNSVHYRNTDYMCAFLVLNCATHTPYYGYKSQDFSTFTSSGQHVSLKQATEKPRPLHLYVDPDGKSVLRYMPSHSKQVSWIRYPTTFEQSIAAKARLKNIQEHYFKDEAIFSFYCDMISQAYAPLSLLYTSEIELPGVYSNAYFIVEIIHQPTGMRQQVVKKIVD